MSPLHGGPPQRERPGATASTGPIRQSADATTDQLNGNGHNPNGLREFLKAQGGKLQNLTVLASKNDPFRYDTPAARLNGKWLADSTAALRRGGRRHIRGLHYALIGVQKPDGNLYKNTDQDFDWLTTYSKAARWLGYIGFEEIVDERNAAPAWTFAAQRDRGRPYVGTNDAEIVIPDAEDFEPRAGLAGFTARQPYHLTLIGEKSSLQPMLDRVAARYSADVLLPNGEASDTMLHELACHAVEDGRPMAVFYFSDCDPAGHQMPISVSRKLQAFQALGYEFEFQMHPVAPTPQQVKLHSLPSTPLKKNEKRADDWFAATGTYQTEIDALAALQPDLLESMATDAINPFFDHTLAGRVARARRDWLAAAQQAIDDQDDVDLEPLREQVAEQLAEKAAEIEEIVAAIEVDADMFELPDVPELPEPVLGGDQPEPLCDSRWDFAEQCRRLIKHKQYDIG